MGAVSIFIAAARARIEESTAGVGQTAKPTSRSPERTFVTLRPCPSKGKMPVAALVVLALLMSAPAGARNIAAPLKCPPGATAAGTGCLLQVPTAPNAVIQKAVMTLVAREAKKHGWGVRCALGPVASRPSGYVCVLFSVDPAGATKVEVDGRFVAGDIHANYSVAHTGCTYSIQSGDPNATAVIIPNGCGASGLARIKRAISSSSD